MIVDRFTGNLRVDLDRRAERPVNVVQVVVGPTGFVGASEQAMVDFIRSAYVGRPRPDLIVSVAGPAAVFARKYRQQLFPDAPLLFAAPDQRYLQGAPLGEKETAVASANDFPGLVDDILQLLPDTSQVFMVMGSGQIGKFWHQELNQPFERFRDRLTFIWSDESVACGDLAPLCEPSTPLGDYLSHVRHRRCRSCVCGRASTRRSSRRGKCSLICGDERVPWLRHCRRQIAVH